MEMYDTRLEVQNYDEIQLQRVRKRCTPVLHDTNNNTDKL